MKLGELKSTGDFSWLFYHLSHYHKI